MRRDPRVHASGAFGVWRAVGVVLLASAGAVVALAAAPAWGDPSPAPDPAPGLAPSPVEPGSPDPTPGSRDPSSGSSSGGRGSTDSPPKPVPQPPPQPAPGGDRFGAGPAWWDIEGQVREAINGFIVWVAKKTLPPILDALGRTVLSTPDLTGDKRVRQVWTGSLVVVNAGLVLFVIAGGFLVMMGPSLRSEHGLKDILPRVGVAVVTANVSLLVIDRAITAANAVTAAVARQGADSASMAAAIEQILREAEDGQGFLFSVLALAVSVMAIVVVFTFILRIMLTVTLIGLAPLALACHALPQTEQIAYTWWRSLAACLGIQVAQAIVLAAALRVFLTPHGATLLGVPSTSRGLLGLLVCLTMLWLLVKIPFWMRHYVLAGLTQNRRGGVIRRAVGTIVAIKTLGGLSRLTAARRVSAPAGLSNRPPAMARVTPRKAAPRRAPPPLPTARRARPGGAAAFSHAPLIQAPLPGRSGNTTPPTFTNAHGGHIPGGAPRGPKPTPAGFSHLPMTRPAIRGGTAPHARFSHPPGAQAPAQRPTGSGVPPARFSHTPGRQSASKRPPAPVTPVFSHPPAPTRGGTRATAPRQRSTP